MATTTMESIQSLFETLESKKSLVTKCTVLYDTLTSHFTSLQNIIDSKTLTLESNLTSLDSSLNESLNNLAKREESIPDRLNSLSFEVEEKKKSAMDEVGGKMNRKKMYTRWKITRVLRCLCRRMDDEGLVRVLIERRKEVDKVELLKGIRRALKECVDGERFVLDIVKEFVEKKGMGKRMADMRWACGVVVSGLFPVEELKDRKGVLFSRKTVAKAEEVVRRWREKTEAVVGGGDNGNGNRGDDGNGDNVNDGNGNGNKGNDGNRGNDGGDGDGYGDKGGGGGSRMGLAEVLMFLQVVVGFGLTGIFEVEFYKKIVLEFAPRRDDMAKLAVVTLGDTLPDFIEELIENGKEVEAVYFASESGLTSRFKPALILQAGLDRCKKNASEIREKGDHTTEEAINYEMKYLRTLIKCVENNKLEAEYSAESLKKQLSILGKAKADRKAERGKGIETSKPSNKRTHTSSRPPSRRSGGGHPPHSAKRPKYPSYSNQGAVPRPLSPVSKYLGTYSIAGQSAPTYGPSYGPSINQISQQHYGLLSGSAATPSAVPQIANYGVPGGSIPSTSIAAHLVRTYGLQSAYEQPPTHQPPSYAP